MQHAADFAQEGEGIADVLDDVVEHADIEMAVIRVGAFSRPGRRVACRRGPRCRKRQRRIPRRAPRSPAASASPRKSPSPQPTSSRRAGRPVIPRDLGEILAGRGSLHLPRRFSPGIALGAEEVVGVVNRRELFVARLGIGERRPQSVQRTMR